MKTLPSALIIEKNRLASPYPWVPLVKFAFPVPTGDVFLAGNLSDVTYGGQLYTAFNIDVQLPDCNVKAVVPECTITAANQSRVFEGMIIDSNGGVDTQVNITIVNTNNLAADYSTLTWSFYILQVNSNSSEVTMTCSLYSPLDRRFPPDRYYGSTCRFKFFKGIECKYASTKTTCDRSLATCRSYSNEANFGGFPGLHDKNIAFLFTKRI